MANPVRETTEQKKQQPQGPERPHSPQKFKAKLMQWVSYIAGDMPAFGEWMKGTSVSQIRLYGRATFRKKEKQEH